MVSISYRFQIPLYIYIYTFSHIPREQYLAHSHRETIGNVQRKKEKETEEEREIAEGLGLVRFMRTDEVFAVDSVCTYDPKILRSFPFGQTSRESQWAHRSRPTPFCPMNDRASCPHPSHQFIGFLAANGYNRHYRVKCAPTKLKIGF